MNIVLISVGTSNKKQLYKEYPLGVGYLATILHDLGYKVNIIDQNVEFFDLKDLLDRLCKIKPDVIGFSVLTASFSNMCNIIKELKRIKINSKLFAGGIHPTLFPEECINNGVDFVIKGEGEIPIKYLVEYLEGKIDIKKVPNIVYKQESGNIINLPNKDLELNINELPIVNRSLYSIEKYDTHSIAGTRGCPYSCKFCCSYNHISGKNYKDRMRTVESIITEIKYLILNYKAKKIFFTDDVFFTKIDNLRKFNKLIKENNININFNAQLRCNMVTDEVCKLLIECGCKKIEVGVEAGSENILKDCCKNITIEHVKNSIETAKRNGLRIKTNWIYGLPGDLKEQYKSIELMLQTRPNEITIHQLIPFPGTEFYNNREKYGIIINDKNFESFYYGNIEENISYKYMSKNQYKKLVLDTINELEKVGYISSDDENLNNEYIYTTPFNKKSLISVP